MRNRKMFVVIPVVLIVPLIALAICWGQPSTSKGEVKTLKIGISAALSGRAAGWGLATLWGAQQAAAELNKAGGVKVGGQTYTVKILQYDDKNSTSGGKAAGEYLIDAEGATMAISIGTVPTIGVQEISEPRKVILFHSSNGAYKTLMGPHRKYTFSHAYDVDALSPVMFSYLRDKCNAKTIAFLAPDTEGGVGFAEPSKGFAEKAGLKIVGYETFSLQATDYYPILSKLIKNKPDAIQYFSIPIGVDALLTKQLYELGWKGIKSHSSGREPAKFIGIAGKEAAENTFLWTLYDFSSPKVPPKMKAFYDIYFAEHREEPTSLGLRSYTGVKLYAEVVSRIGTLDPDKVVAEIEKTGRTTGFDTLVGLAKLGGADFYGIDHGIRLPVALCVIEKNGAVTIHEAVAPRL